ncbi:NmrA family transcriptional regulator [Mesorhizobium sp. M1C.F.Ca.ET.193.01.1.1]|uniref:NAD(P)H-binding protein n=1 Tax=unclassified Mesorhizobium TaxID=325217 RepID=UPI000FD57CBB|nr:MULTISPECIES: NAD(P)H-binding protein [unclassified Mesorhizobium]TGT04559.1 NmrA family transcriptional regulator [bacterium M00.F.Ca.ET.177.01.1.1]TGQ57388.1 NmrA family transcriptional regulator [Mesorhizobium sp. M1C.F.Ca.ET.210.01.1.1]TGQ75845.1 NmrA family transcriptional regulator [Mesorhizobium sp. M1C.F.Ca.ET.212.01.1.1]TGR14228.1 NmrA family transcriptional regulator [Mesorhizobium sp. M1C.F.Ca.ET.204.01.1.1]TGR35390.1 NmrA family transcriptional regulator [Mesorhizobium sp. M1C.F
MTDTTQKPILILGGTGKTGRRLAERLTAKSIPVRIGSRAGTPSFDWLDKGSWDAALEGVGAVYISYYPDIAVPGAAETVEALARLAVERGIKRLVLLSGRGETEAQRAEEMLKASGADWTILRCSWFSQNFSEGFLVENIIEGEVGLPVGAVGEPFVDADDIADVAETVLTEPGHVGQLYELTGPRLLSFAEAVAEIGKAAGRDIRFRQISRAEFTEAVAAHNLPPQFAWLLDELFTKVLDGRNETLTDGVQRALGRQPKDFFAYATETAASGIWSN